MAVKGDLAYQGLGDILRADLAAGGAGRLTLRHGALHAAVVIDETGLYLQQPDLLEPAMVLEGFVERGLLAAEVLERLRGGANGLRILDQLVDDGVLPQAELLEVLALEVEDTVLDLMLWDEGIYRYDSSQGRIRNPGLLARIAVDPIGVVERAEHRLAARHTIAEELGQHGLLVEPVVGELPPLEGPDDPLHAIYMRVDGRMIAHEMALHLGISRFEVLRGLARLHAAGLVRLPEPDDLARAASEWALEGRHGVARALALQWAEQAPQDPSPLRKLASLAQDAGDKEAELDALCALGNLFILRGDHDEALQIFTRAMRQAPADDVVLAGMRVAAQAAGDNDALVDSTLLTAQTKLDEGEANAALEMLEPLLESHPRNMAVHLLRARALVLGEKRSEFFEQAEVVGQVLGRAGCQTAQDREVVEFFRETIAHLAPDRGDLLERFRTIHDPSTRRRRTALLTGALLLVLAGAGFAFWPASAATLLQRAQVAADDGDTEQALGLIAQLVEEHPDAPEVQDAYRLQQRLVPTDGGGSRAGPAAPGLARELEDRMPALLEALAALPAAQARASVEAVAEPLRAPEAKRLRRTLLDPHHKLLRTHIARLHTAALARVEVLARTDVAAEEFHEDAAALQAFLEASTRARDATWIADMKATAEVLYGVAKLTGDADLVTRTQELARAAVGLGKVALFHDKHIGTLRLAHAERLIEGADRACREDAPRHMVAGRLDEADACYARLQAMLARYRQDPLYAELMAGIDRRELPRLLEDRRAQIADVRRRLSAAQAAEDAGDIDGAIAQYASLVSEYWLIRFENVCTLPLRVESTPPGARVLLNDEPVGETPLVVRYAWGQDASVRIELEGFEPATRRVQTSGEDLPSRLHLALVPAPRWTAPTAARAGSRPLLVDGDIVRVDRRGVVTRHAGDDGHVRWTADLSSLEGVRAHPVVVDDLLYVARVDGRLLRVELGSGSVRDDLQLPRPVGDLARLDGHVALATTDGQLIVLADGRTPRPHALDVMPTAGVCGAHGAFWLGTADGTVVRLEPGLGDPHITRCASGAAPVAALVPYPDGMLAVTTDGALHALAPDGARRWSHTELGDLVGTPTVIGAHVAVPDRKGGLRLLALADGTTTRTLGDAHAPVVGLAAVGGTLAVLRRDGHLDAYDPATGTPLLAYPLHPGASFAPLALGEREILVPHGPAGMARLTVPQPRAP